MAHIQSAIPSSSIPSTARTARWRCFLMAAAALQLSACGGGDEAATQVAVGGAAPGLLAVQPAVPVPANCDTQVNDTQEKLLACVTLPGVRAHQAALAEIAKANGGTRLAGSAGYEASVAYARQVLTDAGYRVSVQPFAFSASRTLGSILLESGQAAAEPIAHQVVDYSGSGDVTAPVTRPSGPAGCEAADFAGFVRGHIALIRRGGCDLPEKLSHAVAAGASGVVIYSQYEGDLTATLTSDAPQDIPVVMVGKAVGEQLAQRTLTGVQLHLQTETERSLQTAYNVLAESTGGDPQHVTMLGAHLDSVRAGAGINDNGSGTAAVLETARQMARVQPVNQLRFALWGAEEQGLLGSTYYVKKLDTAQRAKIALYLNFDMIGSPNHVFFVYGGDGSAGSQAISSPALSTRIVATLGDFYTQRHLPFKRLDSGSRSDHKPFADVGIPFGGIFTGAEGIKTAQEAQTWGGTAGQAYDPCYHRACDNMANNNAAALQTNAHAVASSALFFAMNRLPG